MKVLTFLLIITFYCFADEIYVNSAAEITVALSSVQSGDTLTMLDGTWTDQHIVFTANGTEPAPILLRAQTPGKVLLTGTSNLRISGTWLVADGLYFLNGRSSSGGVVEFRGGANAENCRLTNTAIVNYNPPGNATDYKWISLYGRNNRVDHCYLYGKRHSGTTLVVWLDNQPNYHRIDHNYFAYRPELGVNGGETIRIGTSDWSMYDSYTIVESNYFERCNGEIEIISNKSGHNTFRYNTFFESEGALTLRHGNYATVTGNFFLGNNKSNTGGIRIIGENHTIYNNYFQDLQGTSFRSALTIMNGVPDSPLNRYFQVINAHVLFNTFVNCRSNIFLGAGYDSERTLPPLDCRIDNNAILTSSSNFLVDEDDTPINLTWSGNVFYGSGLGIEQPEGITITDPMLAEYEDGLWRPLEISPLLGQAVGSFEFVSMDMDGQNRLDLLDIGADQRSADSVLIRPLTAADVGPYWYPPPDEPQRIIYVQAGPDSLSNAILSAMDDDIIELTSDGGIYSSSSEIIIDKSVFIRAAADLLQKPVIRNTGSASGTLFEMNEGGKLNLDSIALDGMAGTATPAKYLIRTDDNPVAHYSLIAKNCDFYDVIDGADGNFFRAYAGTFADTILFENSLFFNSGKEGIRLKDEASGSGAYNVGYFEMTNCTVWHTNKEAVYIYGGDAVIFTPGPRIRINHCTFNDCGYNSAAVINPLKVDDTQILNSIISNSKGVSPSILIDGIIAQIAYCDTFNIAGIIAENSATIGAGMLGLDPLFEDAGIGDFTLAELSLVRGKANDGKSMGDLRWSGESITNINFNNIENTPDHITLVNNYPNPFNPQTVIRFNMRHNAHVTIQIYNRLGEMVEILWDGSLTAGDQQFRWNASHLASGLYFYRILSNNTITSGKMILLK